MTSGLLSSIASFADRYPRALPTDPSVSMAT